MELVRTFSNPVIGGTWVDNKSITNEMDFVVDDLGPLCINDMDMGDSFYSLLFFATQYSTEETIYLQLFLKSNDRFERDFLDNLPINMNNMLNYKDRIKYYVEHTKDATNNKIYICDMNMIEENSKPYFLSYSFRKDQEEITKINLHFTRDVFVKYNIYMRSFIRKNIAGEIVFNNPKFKNMKFSTIDHIKLDGSGTEIDGNLVFSHYTCGNGPELYKFVTVSKKIKGRKLLNPMGFNVFNELYDKLGRDIYCKLFPVILTDRGSEFSDPVPIECDRNGEQRSLVFYCDPSAPYQKGGIEVAHELIRRVLPKGTSFDNLQQEDIDLMLSHINSYKREKLNNRSANQMFSFLYGVEILHQLNIREIEPNDIILSPKLLRK